MNISIVDMVEITKYNLDPDLTSLHGKKVLLLLKMHLYIQCYIRLNL